MLKAVLITPEFLFRMEESGGPAGTHRLNDFELATRLSYFLWSSAPDEELRRLAAEGRLHEDAVLRGQVARLLDDTRSRHFASAFVGQWLGTKDIGGRIAPTVNAVQHYYTPEVAKDMREEPILLFHHLVAANRSLVEFLDSDYAFVNQRLVKFYEVEDELPVEGDIFQKVQWPNDRRGARDDVALQRDEPGAARRVGARNAAGHAGADSASGHPAASDRGQRGDRAHGAAEASAASRGSVVRGVSRRDRSDRFRA